MKIAIMQPYFFPYLGYWQLIHAVDEFVILDDVKYKNKGWINRNRISYDDREHYIINPIAHKSQNRYINELNFINDSVVLKNMLRTIRYYYRDSKYLESSMEIIGTILMFDNRNVSIYLENEIRVICQYLGITTQITKSSVIRNNRYECGQDAIISFCLSRESNHYINAIGGTKLYDKNKFLDAGLDLSFLKTDFRKIERDFNCSNIGLSVIDLMMRFSSTDIKRMLGYYLLV